MEYRKITAIVNVESLERVTRVLKHEKVEEVAISRVQGYDDYKNFYDSEWSSERARVEAFVPEMKAVEIAGNIAREVGIGTDCSGIVAILPVEVIFHVRAASY